MGKSKAKKYKAQQRNPTGVPSVKEMEECELLLPLNIDTGAIESILEKLQSRKTEDRECAAVIIANMAGDPKFVAALVKNKVIRIAAPLILDRNMAVRHAIAGCLRNIAVFGDYTVSEAMVEQDIMTSLVALLQEYSEPWSPVKSVENKIDSKSEIFLEACNLLWTLCENSDLAVSIFNKKKIVSILLPCLNIEVYDVHTALAVAQCLHTIGENNTDMTEQLVHPLIQERLKLLMSLPSTEPEHMLLKSLAAGIKLNMYSGKLDDCMSDVTGTILEVVSSTLNHPINTLLSLFSKNIMSHKMARQNKLREESDLEEKLVSVKKCHEHLIHLLSAKQISLEILGNMFEDGGNEEWEDASSSESEVADMEVDETSVSVNELGLGIPNEVHKAITNGNMLVKITEQIVIPSDEVLQSIEEYPKAKDCLKRLGTVRCTALLCLNNIIQKLDIADLGGPSKLMELWLSIADLLFKKTEITNTAQVEAATSCMSAVLRKLAEANCSSHFSHMTQADLDLLVNICHQSQNPGIKVHVLRCLGTIGCLLGNLHIPTSANLITVIGNFLLDICTKSADLWVTAEALDVIFDVFGEDHVDGIALEIGLVEKLSHLLPSLKGKIKQQKRSFGEHLPVIQTAQTNLIRFIKYKNDFNKK